MPIDPSKPDSRAKPPGGIASDRIDSDWGVLNPGTKAQWQRLQNEVSKHVVDSMAYDKSAWKISGAQTGRFQYPTSGEAQGHTHKIDDTCHSHSAGVSDNAEAKEWIAKEVTRQVEKKLKEATAWLINELNEAHQMIDDLECDITVAKNSWGFKDPKVEPKYHSGSYRNKQFGEE